MPTTATPYHDLTLNVKWDPKKGRLAPASLEPFREAGGQTVTLAFITNSATKPTACIPTWGGEDNYAVAQKWGIDTINEFRKNGGDVIISFGGAAGTYLEKACQNADSVAKAIQLVIDNYEVNNVDFDIEGANLANLTSITKLATALAKIQQNNSELVISVTLPVLPSGLTHNGLKAVEIFRDNRINFSVNIMAMDYGATAAPNPIDMCSYAIQAITATQKQLNNSIPVIVTPMIGINDAWNYPPGTPEIFNLTAAKQVADYCHKNNIAIRYWSENRDHPCNLTHASNTCSGAYNGQQMQEDPHAFFHALSEKLKETINPKSSTRHFRRHLLASTETDDPFAKLSSTNPSNDHNSIKINSPQVLVLLVMLAFIAKLLRCPRHPKVFQAHKVFNK